MGMAIAGALDIPNSEGHLINATGSNSFPLSMQNTSSFSFKKKINLPKNFNNFIYQLTSIVRY